MPTYSWNGAFNQEVHGRLRLVARHKTLAKVAREIVVGSFRLSLDDLEHRIPEAPLHVEARKFGIVELVQN